MLFFRVQVNSIARAELVPPLCQVHKVDLIPVLDMVPLAPPPPTFSPLSSEPSFCHFLSDCLKTHVFVYLHRRSGTLILRSSYYYILKNIAYVGLICNFDPNCIFVFVFVYMYLCICIFVCADQTPGNIDF